MLNLRLPSPVVELHDDRLAAAGVRVLLKRDDLIHPEVPGNKWRKLKYNLPPSGTTLLTFGGAYSNHLRAVAAAGHHYGFDTIGVVRGEEHLPLNPSLAYATAHGMRLTYLDRTSYRSKDAALAGLHQQFGDFYLLPEGGANLHAVRGCAELLGEITDPFDALFCAVGTGTTLAGLAVGQQLTIGVPVLKAALEDDIVALQQAAFGERVGRWRLEPGYHFGGYAKRKPALDSFIDDFSARHGLLLDWVYEAKMMYALFDQVRQGAFSTGTTIVALIN
ncbi:pyridoxal-phosphate dependent enzyme [Kribbella sp. NPDC051718]|uniref:1-aminocyclopropane-1-carboxylate deaminase/D-cysteine desulfhydrase n=1 Tax=Kribbella sp. NPDC051718 TaxID=3155168 RepID=UPI003423FD65